MAKAARPLTGKVVAITGGARGIGRATAIALAREDMRVAIGDLDVALAERTAAEVGGDTIALPLDVTDPQSFAGFLEQVEQRLGPLDVLVNNAGIMPLGRFWEEDEATTQAMIDINVTGVLRGMKLALPGMVARNSGHVVNIASQAGKAGFAGGATYCATKYAVVGVSEAVRSELRQAGSRVELSCVMPAFVDTELISGLDKVRGSKTSSPEDVANAILDALRHGRFDVYVPRQNGVLLHVTGMLPRAAREAASKAMGADRALSVVADPARRESYETRAAQSAPPHDAGPPAPPGAGAAGHGNAQTGSGANASDTQHARASS